MPSRTMSVISARNRQYPAEPFYSTSADLVKNVPCYRMLLLFFFSSSSFYLSRSVCVYFFVFIAHTLSLRKHVPSDEMVSIRHNKALGDCVFRELDVVVSSFHSLFLLTLHLPLSQHILNLYSIWKFPLPLLGFDCKRFIDGLSIEQFRMARRSAQSKIKKKNNKSLWFHQI